jgi:hypothetical protein
MKTAYLKRVRSLFCCANVPTHVQRHNCRQWVKSVRFLGDKWLLATQIEKKEAP